LLSVLHCGALAELGHSQIQNSHCETHNAAKLNEVGGVIVPVRAARSEQAKTHGFQQTVEKSNFAVGALLLTTCLLIVATGATADLWHPNETASVHSPCWGRFFGRSPFQNIPMEQVGTNVSGGTLFNPPDDLPLICVRCGMAASAAPELGPFLF